MSKTVVHTQDAPQGIGPYSQAVKIGNQVFLSGQIGLDPASGMLVDGFEAQAHRVFQNMRAVCMAAGGDLNDMVKIGVFVTDLSVFSRLNEIMAEYFSKPYPARSAVQVAALPRGAQIAVDGSMILSNAS